MPTKTKKAADKPKNRKIRVTTVCVCCRNEDEVELYPDESSPLSLEKAYSEHVCERCCAPNAKSQNDMMLKVIAHRVQPMRPALVETKSGWFFQLRGPVTKKGEQEVLLDSTQALPKYREAKLALFELVASFGFNKKQKEAPPAMLTHVQVFSLNKRETFNLLEDYLAWQKLQ